MQSYAAPVGKRKTAKLLDTVCAGKQSSAPQSAHGQFESTPSVGSSWRSAQ
jgi:hypothetical protein